jgi:hypothetical protein
VSQAGFRRMPIPFLVIPGLVPGIHVGELA